MVQFVQECWDMKREAQKQIVQILCDLEMQTGLHISDLNIERTMTAVHSVNIKLEL